MTLRTTKQRAASRVNGRRGGRPGKYNIALECLVIAICKGIDLTLDLQTIARVPEHLLYKLRAELISAAIQ